jgi:hypothetical protein
MSRREVTPRQVTQAVHRPRQRECAFPARNREARLGVGVLGTASVVVGSVYYARGEAEENAWEERARATNDQSSCFMSGLLDAIAVPYLAAGTATVLAGSAADDRGRVERARAHPGEPANARGARGCGERDAAVAVLTSSRGARRDRFTPLQSG